MGKIFRRGLFAIAPVALTMALLLWLFNTLESLFQPIVEGIVGKEHYFNGIGILVALVLIFFIGMLINNWILQKLRAGIDTIFRKIPLVKTLYNSIGEMMSYFSSKDSHKEGKVVMVEIAGMKCMGMITRDDFSSLAPGIAEPGEVAVYLPMSYQIGGYTVMIPKSRVTVVSMTMEEGMRFAITAGVLSHSKNLK